MVSFEIPRFHMDKELNTWTRNCSCRLLSHFENGNFWTASGGALRYKVVPDTGESPRLTAEVWEGPWRYQDSTVEETKEFPLSEEGLEELRGWLARWRTEMNARPKKTLEETLAARAARRAELEAAAAGKQEGETT